MSKTFTRTVICGALLLLFFGVSGVRAGDTPMAYLEIVLGVAALFAVFIINVGIAKLGQSR